jgi:hypothetical protein
LSFALSLKEGIVSESTESEGLNNALEDDVEQSPGVWGRRKFVDLASILGVFNPTVPLAGPGFFLRFRYSQVHPLLRHKEHAGLS